MIKIDGLVFSYGKKKLFDNLNLSLDPGLYGLLGKNGAGKSTLLKILSGLLYPGSGNCSAAGFDPLRRDADFLSALFYLPEEFQIPAVKGSAFADIYAPFYPDFDRQVFDNCIREFDLETGRMLTSLSYGQRKKYLISFGLASGAKILLLDEPTNGLDIPSKTQFRRLAASAASDDRCIIISTHQVRDMEGLIDPVIILDNGRIIFKKSMDEVCRRIKCLISRSIPEGEGIIYTEKIPGGWAVLMENNGEQEGTALDLEVLFNAVTGKREVFERIFMNGEGKNG